MNLTLVIDSTPPTFMVIFPQPEFLHVKNALVSQTAQYLVLLDPNGG